MDRWHVYVCVCVMSPARCGSTRRAIDEGAQCPIADHRSGNCHRCRRVRLRGRSGTIAGDRSDHGQWWRVSPSCRPINRKQPVRQVPISRRPDIRIEISALPSACRHAIDIRERRHLRPTFAFLYRDRYYIRLRGRNREYELCHMGHSHWELPHGFHQACKLVWLMYRRIYPSVSHARVASGSFDACMYVCMYLLKLLGIMGLSDNFL